MIPLTMRIKKLIYKFEDKKTFKNLKANTILVKDLREKFHKGYIRVLQWLVLIIYYSNWRF